MIKILNAKILKRQHYFVALCIICVYLYITNIIFQYRKLYHSYWSNKRLRYQYYIKGYVENRQLPDVEPALLRPKSHFLLRLGKFEKEIEHILQNKTQQRARDEYIKKYGANAFLDDKISLHRQLKDPRPKA